MRLSDIMSHMDLATYPKLAMVLFIAVFVFVLVRVLRTPRSEFDSYANLPVEEQNPTPSATKPAAHLGVNTRG